MLVMFCKDNLCQFLRYTAGINRNCYGVPQELTIFIKKSSMINRYYTTHLVDEVATTGKIIVIYGARQVGKTTLVKEVLKSYSGKILEITADELPYSDILSSRDFSKLQQLVEDMTCSI